MGEATAQELPRLEEILELMLELDVLERTLPERTQKALAHAGVEKPRLSGSAKEAVAQSEDARRETDRLLTRRCNRADSAVGVAKEILVIAKLDMREANVFDNWIPEDDPTKTIYSELYWAKRKFVERLRAFIRTAGNGESK